jgi:hypothetical protein
MKLPEINFCALPKLSFSIIIGKRACGKSELLIGHVEQICKTRPIDKIFVFDPTAKHTNAYDAFDKNKTKLYHAFNSDSYDEMCAIQESLDTNNESIIVIDNVVLSNTMHILDVLVFNGKSMKFTIIMTVQTFMSDLLRPEYMANYDFLFIAWDDVIPNQKKNTQKIFFKVDEFC